MRFISLQGQAISTVFHDLAQLRIMVFKDFPYLYEGSMEYEMDYLHIYSKSERAFLFAVYDDTKMVGATTCIPLADETVEIQTTFLQHEMDISSIFYFGESILLPAYRGMGLGHRFFDEREKHALSFNEYKTTCFCSVIRPINHPLAPQDYRTNEAFWSKRGYVKQEKLTTEMSWLDVGEIESTSKKMVFYTKNWS